MKTKVLIIGAGPTGLMLANQLMRFGIEFQIVDGKSEPTNQSRALAVSARSMELYQQLGLSDTVLKKSTQITGFQILQNGKKKAEVNLENLGDNLSDFPNFMNAFEQSKNETLLTKNLENNDIEVLWNWEFQSFDQNDNQVITEIRNNLTEEKKVITSNFIVGCDGASSPVRKQLGLKFDGGTYENKFFVVDTKIDWKLPYNKIILAPSDYQFITFFPLKGERNMRVIGTLPKSFNETEEIDIEALEEIIKKATRIELDFTERGWNAIYKLHHRSVNQFNVSNVFIAGDAAHIHSPAGGQGMNTGLQDAHNLAWKIAMVIQGNATKNLLHTYNEERLPIAKQLLNSTDGGFKFLAGDSFWIRWIRKLFLIPIISKLLSIKRFRLFAFKKISQIDYSYSKQSLSISRTKQKLSFNAGDRLPYIRKEFYTLFNSAQFHLIWLSNHNEQNNPPLENPFRFPTKIHRLSIDENWKKLGVKNELFIVLRPDQHILWICDSLTDLKSIKTEYFKQ